MHTYRVSNIICTISLYYLPGLIWQSLWDTTLYLPHIHTIFFECRSTYMYAILYCKYWYVVCLFSYHLSYYPVTVGKPHKGQLDTGFSGKIVFFHDLLQPLPRLHRCKRPQSSKLNASVQSFLLAGNFLYNQ